MEVTKKKKKKSGMSNQQLPSFYSAPAAASLQSSPSVDYGSSSSLAAFSSSYSFCSSRSPLSDTESSIGASSTSVCGEEEDADWCLPQAETRPTCGGHSSNRRARRRGGDQRQPLDRVPVNRGGPSAAKKKNAREKEKVKNVREEYETLGAVLGSRVGRGSGHFSKARILADAIRHIRELQEVMLQKTVKQTTTQEAGTVGVEPSSPLLPPPPQQINLNCDERLQPTNTSLGGFFQEEIVPTYTHEVAPDDLPPAYFSYNSGADTPPVTSSQCLFSLPSGGPLPPFSSLVYSPEMAGHLTHSSGAAPASIGGPLSPLGVSPPPQHPYSCGSDV